MPILILRFRIGGAADRHIAVHAVRLEHPRLERHLTDPVRELRCLDERVMLVVLRRRRGVREERIVHSRPRLAGEVQRAAPPRRDLDRGVVEMVVERTVLPQSGRHDVPAPPAAVVERRLVHRQHRRDRHRAVHRTHRRVRGVVAGVDHGVGGDEKSRNAADRRPHPDREVRGPRLARLGGQLGELDDPDIFPSARQQLGASIDVTLVHPVRHHLNMHLRILVSPHPGEAEHRDAVQERRAQGHRHIRLAAHRLKQHRAVVDAHMQHHETVAATPATRQPVARVVSASLHYGMDLTAAAAAAQTILRVIRAVGPVVGIVHRRAVRAAITTVAPRGGAITIVVRIRDGVRAATAAQTLAFAHAQNLGDRLADRLVRDVGDLEARSTHARSAIRRRHARIRRAVSAIPALHENARRRAGRAGIHHKAAAAATARRLVDVRHARALAAAVGIVARRI